MKALSILQPYAWLIVSGHKDVENREWYTRLRGRILVHVGLKYPMRDHQLYAQDLEQTYGIELPAYSSMPRGGICGEVEIVDCVRAHPSKWKSPGSWGFVLANARPLEFRPYRGTLGFFDVDA